MDGKGGAVVAGSESVHGTPAEPGRAVPNVTAENGCNGIEQTYPVKSTFKAKVQKGAGKKGLIRGPVKGTLKLTMTPSGLCLTEDGATLVLNIEIPFNNKSKAGTPTGGTHDPNKSDYDGDGASNRAEGKKSDPFDPKSKPK